MNRRSETIAAGKRDGRELADRAHDLALALAVEHGVGVADEERQPADQRGVGCVGDARVG